MRMADALGATFSTLCIVHCIALPVVAIVLPTLAAVAEVPIVHQTLAVLTLLASIAVVLGSRPVARWFLGLAALGNVAVLYAAFAPISEDMERTVTVGGAALLAVAHFVRLARPHRAHTTHCR